MDDPKPSPSDPHRSPEHPEDQELAAAPAHPEGPFSSEPVRDAPEYGVVDAGEPAVAYTEPEAEVVRPHVPLADALPGDAAPAEVIPLDEPADVRPPVVIEESEFVEVAAPAAPAGTARGHGSFTLWLLIWLAFWTGGMASTLNHRFDRRFDWNTSYFSIAARNLVRDGFVARHGGLHLNAGDVRDYPGFYAGHPPLTGWLLYGWMKAFGTDRDWVVRSLPLTFTVLNLLLLFALVRRVFGAPAALAATVVCSLLPMTAYYAQIVNMEPFVLTFVLGASLGYLAWSRSGSRLGYLLMCACVILGCWTDWPMYLFAGLLAVVHFFARRPGAVVETRGEADEVVRPRRPVLSTLVLLLLPAAMFGLFLGYLTVNGSSVKELWYRASERLATAAGEASHSASTAATTAATVPAMQSAVATTPPSNGYHLLLERFTHRDQLKGWLLDLFTPPALMLAVVGLALWPRWSRRLSLASGEAGRRAMFRVLLCIVLTQVIYTLVFAQAAWEHEFWQYYLAVPVALLAGGLCTWLTVAGGPERGFFPGVMDRAGWAVAALIPLLAVGPFAYRMHLPLPGKSVPPEDSRIKRDYVEALRQATKPGDVILTDWDDKGIGFALPWYADRTFVTHFDVEQETRSLAAIAKLREQFKDRRIFYLWGDYGSEALFEALTRTFPQQPAGPVMLYRIHDPGQADVPLPGGSATTAPAATATAPATQPTAQATTKPAP